jgi:hypothetical protein
MPRNSVPAAGSPDTHRSDGASVERQSASADADGHVRTLPFGTKGLVGSPSPSIMDARPYRFVITKLPTFAEQQQAAALRLPPDAYRGGGSGPAHHPQPEPSSKRRWLLMLGAMAVTAFVFALLVLPDTSSLPQEGKLPREPAAVGHSAARAQSTPAAAEPATETASRPATPLESPPRPITLPERAAKATTLPQSPVSSPAPAPKAGMALKRGSVLASVLAPPPAD